MRKSSDFRRKAPWLSRKFRSPKFSKHGLYCFVFFSCFSEPFALAKLLRTSRLINFRWIFVGRGEGKCRLFKPSHAKRRGNWSSRGLCGSSPFRLRQRAWARLKNTHKNEIRKDFFLKKPPHKRFLLVRWLLEKGKNLIFLFSYSVCFCSALNESAPEIKTTHIFENLLYLTQNRGIIGLAKSVEYFWVCFAIGYLYPFFGVHSYKTNLLKTQISILYEYVHHTLNRTGLATIGVCVFWAAASVVAFFVV